MHVRTWKEVETEIRKALREPYEVSAGEARVWKALSATKPWRAFVTADARVTSDVPKAAAAADALMAAGVSGAPEAWSTLATDTLAGHRSLVALQEATEDVREAIGSVKKEAASTGDLMMGLQAMVALSPLMDVERRAAEAGHLWLMATTAAYKAAEAADTAATDLAEFRPMKVWEWVPMVRKVRKTGKAAATAFHKAMHAAAGVAGVSARVRFLGSR